MKGVHNEDQTLSSLFHRAAVLGAGGGGFLVFYVQPERQDAVRWAMRDLLYIPFKFEDGGTRVIHYTPEDYTPKD